MNQNDNNKGTDDLQLMNQFDNMNIKNNRRVSWSNNLKIIDENQNSEKKEKIHKRKKTPLKNREEKQNINIDKIKN